MTGECIQLLLDRMRRLDIDPDTIIHVVNIGERHVGRGLFRVNYLVEFDDGKQPQVWYNHYTSAFRNKAVEQEQVTAVRPKRG